MNERLFDEFQEVSAKAWKQKIQYDLRGADYNEKLVWESPEGIKVKPFYHLDDHKFDYQKTLRKTANWQIAQEIFVADGSRANDKAFKALRRGAETLYFIIPSEKIEINKLLTGIDLDTVCLYFKFQFLSVSYIEKMMDFLKDNKSSIYLNIDIIGHLARMGNWFSNKVNDEKALGEILNLSKIRKNINVIGVDVSLYQNAGANIVQQVAYAIAHINEYLNGYGADLIQGPVFSVSVGNNYFFEIAKIRALRKIWAALASEYGLNSPCHIIATPSKRNKTIYSYNTNMLRTTTECMSAILGGADSICNLPYDSIYHKNNEFGERIARNQLLLLKNESRFDAGENPAAGSYYIGALTEQITEKSLELFKHLERNGGFLKQLKNHTIQRKIKESALKEGKQLDSGEEILVGTNAYTNSLDKMKDTLEIYPFISKKGRKTLIAPIVEKRLAEEIERKRLRTEGWSEK